MKADTPAIEEANRIAREEDDCTQYDRRMGSCLYFQVETEKRAFVLLIGEILFPSSHLLSRSSTQFVRCPPWSAGRRAIPPKGMPISSERSGYSQK